MLPWSRSPPESSRHSRPSAASRQRAGSHEVLRPFDDVIQASPLRRRRPFSHHRVQRDIHPAAGPLPGFCNLSAVHWHAWTSRPCLMPLPSVGFTLQSVPPRRGRASLSGPLAPTQFSTAVPEVRCTWPRPPGFTDARAVWRGGLDSPGAPAPFPPLASQRLPRRLEPRAPSPPRSGGFGCLEAFFPPRGRCARRGGFPPSTRPVALLGFRPSRALLRSSLGSFMTRWTVPSTAELAPRRREMRSPAAR